MAPRPVPPPIPAKKLAPENFSGMGTDTVGPAKYDPKFTQAKKTASETFFAASKTKRTIFEPTNRKENEMPPRDLPGPGKYDSEFIVNNKMFNSTGNNSMFLSKVAKLQKSRATSQPGPGTYDVKTVPRGDPSMIGSQQESSTEQSSVMTSNANPFLSSTGRGDMWKNQMNAPFTRASFLKNPGPGSYGQSKNKDDIKQRLLQEEKVVVPFNSSDTRPDLATKTSNPGPGTYINVFDSKHSCLHKSLLKGPEDREMAAQQGVKPCAFGSNSARSPFWMEPKKGLGPGEYDVNMDMADATTDLEKLGKDPKSRIKTSYETERRKVNSVFT